MTGIGSTIRVGLALTAVIAGSKPCRFREFVCDIDASLYPREEHKVTAANNEFESFIRRLDV